MHHATRLRFVSLKVDGCCIAKLTRPEDLGVLGGLVDSAKLTKIFRVPVGILGVVQARESMRWKGGEQFWHFRRVVETELDGNCKRREAHALEDRSPITIAPAR